MGTQLKMHRNFETQKQEIFSKILDSPESDFSFEKLKEAIKRDSICQKWEAESPRSEDSQDNYSDPGYDFSNSDAECSADEDLQRPEFDFCNMALPNLTMRRMN